MSSQLSAPSFTRVRRAADCAAARLVRRFRLPSHEREDIRHDLLVELLVRLKHFDPRRGSLICFADMVMRNHAVRLAGRIQRNRALFAPVSLDEPPTDQRGPATGATVGDTFANEDGYLAWMSPRTNPAEKLEARLSLERALNTLPSEHLRLCARLVRGSVGRASMDGHPSRATLYRQLNEVRLRLLIAGVGATA